MGFSDWLNDTVDWVDQHTNPFHGSFGPDAAEKKQQAATGAVPAQGPLAPGVEATLSGMRWLYSNGISQPVTTLDLMLNKVGAEPGDAFKGSEWRKSWYTANDISPGQAIGFTVGGSNEERLKKVRALENAPLEFTRPDAQYLPPGFTDLPWDEQQRQLQAAGMPSAGNALIQQKRRESDLFKFGSGAGDFALSWYADPVVLGGKALGRAKTMLVTRPVSPTWTGAKIDQELARSPMVHAQDFIFANRDNPALLNNLAMAKNSALGQRFGAIASSLTSPEEVNLFLRVGMGDVRAMDQLTAKNANAALIMEQDTSRLSALGLLKSTYVGPGHAPMQSLIDAEMTRLQGHLSANANLVQRYESLIGTVDEAGKLSGGIAHQIDALNTTRWSFARAEAATEAQGAYTAGPALNGGAGRPRGFTAERSIGTPGRPMRTPIADPTPGGEGLVKTRLYTNFFGTGLTMIRSLGEFTPRGHISVQSIDRDSVNELRGFIARIPAITPAARTDLLNQYLKTANESERLDHLRSFQRLALQRLSSKHGLSSAEGDAIFNAHSERVAAEKAAMQERYSTASLPADPTRTAAGLPRLSVDAYEPLGGGTVIHPNLVSRLVNSEQMMDLDHWDSILSRHSGALQALKAGAGSAGDFMDKAADFFTTAWKFGTLFRLGYIPRVLGDDLGGQIARLGAAQMALRAGWGVKNAATNMARAYAAPMLQAREASLLEGNKYIDSELARLGPQIKDLESQLTGRQASNARDAKVAQDRFDIAQARVQALQAANATPARQAAAQQLLRMRELANNQAQARMYSTSPGKMTQLNTLRMQAGHLAQHKTLAEKAIEDARAGQEKVIQGSQDVLLPNGMRIPGALTGQRGGFYAAAISSDDSLGNIFNSNKQMLEGNLQRSWDHGAVPVSAIRNEAAHTDAWLHVLNAQFGNDPLARLALANSSVEDMATWLRSTGAGQRYMQRLGEHANDPQDVALRVFHDVAEIAPDPFVRAQVLTKEGITAAQLKERFPDPRTRPEVHTAQSAQNLAGSNGFGQTVSGVMNSWFKWAATVPADRMSRHPLFNQLYTGHAKRITAAEEAQGRTLTTVNDANRIAESARALALRDTRKLVFDIAHRTDAASALRYIAPFYSATAEGWQRWARIIGDKPEVAGYAAKAFNVPMALGVVQDADGNHVDQYGYSYDPVTKQRTLVSKKDRVIVARLPKFLVEGHNPIGLALGADPNSGQMNLSQDSMNLVLQGDPWFNPGEGPIVTIPLQELVKDKPQLAEMAREIGVLPFGVSTSTAFGNNALGRAMDAYAPRTIRNFLTAFDTTDDRYQATKMHILQSAAFEHAQFGKPMPSAQEIADRTRNYWLFSASSAFLGPVAGQSKDPYQFYRDEYNKMRRMAADGGPSADDQFLSTYGESYFIFAQAQSKNLSGVPATKKAAALSQKYADLIEANPELGALIIGPEGNGPFSPEAYAYQLNTPLIPGGAEMQRTRLSADEAMTENQRRLGWSKFTAQMNRLTAELVKRNLKSFTDDGAQDLLAQKQGYTKLYSSPLYPDGTTNPYYIEAWAKDYNSFDQQKYAEMIPGLTQLAHSSLAAPGSNRTDLRVLQEYLGARQAVSGLLNARKKSGGASSLTAKANADLAAKWMTVVQGLVARDTNFGDLYHRYLSRDLGVDAAPEEEAATNGLA